MDGVMEWFPCTDQAAMQACLLKSDTGDESLLLYLNLQHTHLPQPPVVQTCCRAVLQGKQGHHTLLASLFLAAK